jgi:hypothetical protein
MRELLEILFRNPILAVLLAVWILSGVLGAIARRARSARPPPDRMPAPPSGPGPTSEPAPPREPVRPSVEDIAEEIRRAFRGEGRPAPLPPPPVLERAPPPRAPVPAGSEASVDEESGVDRRLRERTLRVEKRRLELEQRETRGETGERGKTLAEEIADKQVAEREDLAQRQRVQEAARQRLGTLGREEGARGRRELVSLPDFASPLSRAQRRLRAERRRTRGSAVDLSKPASAFLMGEIFGTPRALSDLER